MDFILVNILLLSDFLVAESLPPISTTLCGLSSGLVSDVELLIFSGINRKVCKSFAKGLELECREGGC